MANDYVLFSAEIDSLTEEESQWWVRTLEAIEEGKAKGKDWEWTKESLGSGISQEDWECLDFQYAIHTSSVWFYSEESGNPGQICFIVQRFLQLYRPEEQFHISWAITCSKPRVDHFGGGAAAVTKDHISFLDTGGWLDNEFDVLHAYSGETNVQSKS